jgi:hypothetical protein
MAIDPATNKSRGNACFASGWYDYLLNRTLTFMDRTGLIMIETDGPYPGYSCASTNHSHHRDNDDSVYQQNLLQGNYFRALRERSVYINQPDYYFYQGGSKMAMGYNENQYSLPRWMDISVSRLKKEKRCIFVGIFVSFIDKVCLMILIYEFQQWVGCLYH